MAGERFEFVVEGISRFPIDMLRYDRACPYREVDSARISATYWWDRAPEETEGVLKRVEVTLTGEREPTVRRWASFGWRVVRIVRIAHPGTVRERRDDVTRMTLGL